MVYVDRECGVVAVNLLLAQFEPPCAAEHHVYDSCVPQRCYNPLPWCAIGTKAYDEATAPQEYLSKIVRAAYNAIEACAHELFGALLFAILFCVSAIVSIRKPMNATVAPVHVHAAPKSAPLLRLYR